MLDNTFVQGNVGSELPGGATPVCILLHMRGEVDGEHIRLLALF